MKRFVSTTLVVALVVAIFVLGCGKKETEVKIGVITALTGEQAKYGESTKRGIEMAIEEVNASGGISGKKVTALYEDSQGDPKLAVSALRKLITVNKIFVTIGALASSDILAMAPVAESNKIVLLAPSATAPAITNAGDYIFRIAASDVYEGSFMAEYALKDLNLERVAVIYINNDYGLGLRETFGEKYRELGGKIVEEQVFDQGATDFRSQLTKLKNANPQGIYVVGYKEVGQLLRQAGELGIKTQWLSTSMFEDPDIIKLAETVSEGAYFTSQSFDPEKGGAIVSEFVKSFEKKYTMVPDIFAALSYDATKVLLIAVEKGGYSTEGIKESLYGIKNFPGITGEFTFDENGDVTKQIGIKTIRNGQFEWVRRN